LDLSRPVDDACRVRILLATVGLVLVATACQSSAKNVVRDDVTLIRQVRDGDVIQPGWASERSSCKTVASR